MPLLIAGHFGQHRTSASKTPGVPCFFCSRSCSWELVNKRLVSELLFSLRNSSRSWMDRCTRVCELGSSAASNKWQFKHTITPISVFGRIIGYRCLCTVCPECIKDLHFVTADGISHVMSNSKCTVNAPCKTSDCTQHYNNSCVLKDLVDPAALAVWHV